MALREQTIRPNHEGHSNIANKPNKPRARKPKRKAAIRKRKQNPATNQNVPPPAIGDDSFGSDQNRIPEEDQQNPTKNQNLPSAMGDDSEEAQVVQTGSV